MRLQSAADAERWGLIWASVEDAALSDEAAAIARRLASGPTEAHRRIKAVFNQQPARTLGEQLAVEAVLQEQLAATRDFAEGVLAFRSKRTPKFKVRGYTRCQRCGRSQAVYRKFGLCRICFREMAHAGELPGVTKSSW